MPGILPMKVIKVGSNAQTRIAQACDRCRSKKIRCDGLRPCTQCGNVGFECKTSDKLSRRAFPRGYTESLEERVRALESEVRELKDLLDEKDEKIDMLSKIYDRSPQRRASSVSSQTISKELRQSSHDDRLDHFKCYQPQCFLTRESRDSLFIGSSSAWAFINSFKHKVQELGRHCSTLDADAFYPPHPNPPNSGLAKPNEKRLWNLPPRLMSDQMITVYFQEWAPLFPILHRPAFLALYEDYVSTPEAVQDRRSLVQLQLVFAIAALSNEDRFSHNAELTEPVWSSVLNDFVEEVSLPTLQCLLLAQIYYIQTGNATKLLHYKSLSFGMVQKLGLHLAQKRFALGALTMESRKKIFWTFYTLDCFSAVFLGLPKCLKDQDISCEYPVDVDDEYITEKGFQPTLPGEFTRLSSALALFRISRILSRVIEQNYPGSAPAELSLSKMTALDEELDTWSSDLAQHLRLEFCNDKPSTHVISSRCPLLSMTYHYIRALIHRPAVTANLGDRGSTSMMALASSSKHLIQIVQLMEERRLSFTHCINKNELLLMSGFGVLFQALELDRRAKLMRDSQKSACIVVDFLCRRGAPGAETLKRLVCSLLLIDPTTLRNGLQNGENARNLMLPKALSSRAALANAQAALKNGRRAPSTMSTDSTRQDSDQTLEKSPSNSSAETARSQPKAKTSKSHSPRTATASSDAGYFEAATNIKSSVTPSEHPRPNLDYFQFPGDPCSPKGRTKAGQSQAPQHNATVWQKLLNTLDETQIHNVEDFYHWSSADQLASPMSLATSHPTPGSSVSSARELPLPHGPDLSGASADLTWTPDIWASRTMPFVNAPPTIPQSVFSFSEESLLSGDGMEGEHDSMSRGTDSPKGMMDGGHGQGDVLISQSTPDGGHESDEAYDFELLRRELSL